MGMLMPSSFQEHLPREPIPAAPMLPISATP